MKKKLLTLAILLLTALLILPGSTVKAAGSDIVVTAQTHVGNFGREARTFTLSGLSEEDAANIVAEDFIISKDYVNPANTLENEEDVISVEFTDGNLILTVSPFRYNPSPFIVTYVGAVNQNLSFTKEQISEVTTDIADNFTVGELDNMIYRLYVPEDASEPLPLIVWHHGMGSVGTDNVGQVVNLLGATPFIAKYENVVVLAPQCQRFDAENFQDWTEITPAIQTLIEQLVADNVVDANRVYGTGCSFGGYGVIMDAAENSDLFTAILISCPLLNESSSCSSFTDGNARLSDSSRIGRHPAIRETR